MVLVGMEATEAPTFRCRGFAKRVIASMLLDAGARLDVRDNLFKSTPLGWACRWGRVELVRLLLARGADPVEAQAQFWATPRAWAAKKKQPDILAMLDAAGR